MTDDEMREALRLALNAWEAAKRQAAKRQAEQLDAREYIDAVTNGEEDRA